VRSLLAAIAFLTRFPVGRLAAFEKSDVSRGAAWFPLVGVLLGAIYAGAAALFVGRLPAAMTGVLLVIVDALATGALHLDGLADSADGFGGGRTREDVLRIMRDHAIGSYGGVALAIAVAWKGAAYSALLAQPHWVIPIALAPTLGRWSILLLTAWLPYARATESAIQGMGKPALLWGTLMSLIAVAAVRSIRAWTAMSAVVLLSVAFGLYCRRRIGGITGDTLGANLEICEAAVLAAFLWATPQ
jgi:cobalamin 5'-phosphate synthase/cobalamin synthase